jgi:hypothetical protein
VKAAEDVRGAEVHPLVDAVPPIKRMKLYGFAKSNTHGREGARQTSVALPRTMPACDDDFLPDHVGTQQGVTDSLW